MWRLVLALPFFTGGLFFLTVGTIGLLRLPDVFTRLHATSKCDTLGAGLTIASLVIVAPGPDIALKHLLLVGLILIINPTAAHVIGNAAYRYGGLAHPATRGLEDQPTTGPTPPDHQDGDGR